MSQQAEVQQIVDQYRYGLITHEEMFNGLDDMRIRGAFDSEGVYHGYDYQNQEWVAS